MKKAERLFQPGELVMTRGVMDKTEESQEFSMFVLASLSRHLSGDWGDLGEEDKALNNNALDEEAPDRVFSMYKKGEEKIYIITEWDRSYTTVLFPSEY